MLLRWVRNRDWKFFLTVLLGWAWDLDKHFILGQVLKWLGLD
jgi:hypothetical protein